VEPLKGVNAGAQPTPPEAMGLAAFNALPGARARAVLLTCCRSGRWAGEVSAGRPYPSLRALLAEAGAALRDEDVSDALTGHPRIGQPPAGAHGTWSRSEQAGVTRAAGDVLAELAEGNRVYEARFGHIYLVCAAGRGTAELLQVLRERLRNDPLTERRVVRDELRKINELRLERLLGNEHSHDARA